MNNLMPARASQSPGEEEDGAQYLTFNLGGEMFAQAFSM